MKVINAVLLDMDGTILNSIPAAERVWSAWARRHGLSPDSLLPHIHGVQAAETISRLGLTGLDPVAEAAAISRMELEDTAGTEPISGAAAFLATLPCGSWAIVTSAPRALALRRIAAAGLPAPALLVAAEDVPRGKPAPDCFHLAAGMLGTTAERCLVLEDSAAGIAAAERAGASVLVVTAAHRAWMAVPHPAIRDYRDLTMESLRDGVKIRLCGQAADRLHGACYLLRRADQAAASATASGPAG